MVFVNAVAFDKTMTTRPATNDRNWLGLLSAAQLKISALQATHFCQTLFKVLIFWSLKVVSSFSLRGLERGLNLFAAIGHDTTPLALGSSSYHEMRYVGASGVIKV